MSLSRGHLVPGTLGLTLAVWLVFSWPLAPHLRDGIPMSSQNVEKGHARAMVPGDHLQLLYHFELVRDMLAGRTPWFYNLYEFNTGHDAERYRPSAYFAPFSLPYALLAAAGGRALAWNLVGFLSLWLTALATALLAGRFVTSRLAVYGAALTALLIPFRWVNLLGGSPAGFAMAWVPLTALGVDRAVRDGRASGGVLAGLALLLACWSDTQVFFFCTVSFPLWLLLSWIGSPPDGTRSWKRLATALAPILPFLLAAFFYRYLLHEHLSSSGMGRGRSLAEVKLFSPTWRGFWQWAAEGLQSHVYIGWMLPLLLLAGGYALWRNTRTGAPESLSRFFVFLLCAAAIGDVMILALGVHGPFDGIALKIVRKLLPPYSMVRQTAKIFCLLPTLAALAGALSLEGWRTFAAARPRIARGAVLVGLLLLAAEMRGQVRPTVCLLDSGQGAYAAVAGDARGRSTPPRALVLPLWPGDSSWASIYEYYAQMHGIRMINGYSPVVRRDYVEQVFRTLESVNQGWLTDGQLDHLARMKTGYVLVHENIFPEKVSPFPVGLTLDRLRRHPRLTLLGQAENVWAFRIESAGAARAATPPGPNCPATFPARRWEWESVESEGGTAIEEASAGGGAFWRATSPEDWAATRPVRAAPDPALHWLIRGRGQGSVEAIPWSNDAALPGSRVQFDSGEWTWRAIPASGHGAYGPLQLRLGRADGSVDLDTALLCAGDWPLAWPPGERVEIPAACLFHGGFSEGDNVVFRERHDPESAILYGPKLPLPPGSYRVELVFESDAPAGAPLGRFSVRTRDEEESDAVAVSAGRPCVTTWRQTGSLPVNAVFVYARNHDVRVVNLIIEATHATQEGMALPGL